MKKQFGLLGRKLTHSYSPQIHQALGAYSYTLFEKEPEEITDFLKSNAFSGLNVTIPYKKTAYALCDICTETAQKLKNVNTVLRLDDGRLLGHNTDYFGFLYVLQMRGISIFGKKVLVLGSGGASATVQTVLKDHGAGRVVVISRTGEDNYQNLNRHLDANVIINATPVGMFPHNGNAPLDLAIFPHLDGVIDLIYNPAKTALLLQAESLNIPCANGLSMLVAQAKESAEYFTGKAISDSQIDCITHQLKADMRNIILVGMPGCGKTTIGKELALKTKRPFYDTDAWMVEKAGISIPQIFKESGEAGFRALESQALEELGKRSGCVIATGGGCVTVERNRDFLKQNGFVVWLKRNVHMLETQGRPLSENNDLNVMYETRKPFYKSFSDAEIELGNSPAQTAEKILEMNHEYFSH